MYPVYILYPVDIPLYSVDKNDNQKLSMTGSSAKKKRQWQPDVFQKLFPLPADQYHFHHHCLFTPRWRQPPQPQTPQPLLQWAWRTGWRFPERSTRGRPTRSACTWPMPQGPSLSSWIWWTTMGRSCRTGKSSPCQPKVGVSHRKVGCLLACLVGWSVGWLVG